ncbi:MAG: hypothetical protein CMF55_06915 [Legionellales bacterium]|nr:hypothetical protein [Legionellales bacterium]HAG61286.1 hypothetical protein [Coxiellaceae bacterium]
MKTLKQSRLGLGITIITFIVGIIGLIIPQLFSFALLVCQWILLAILTWTFLSHHASPNDHTLTAKQQLSIFRSIALPQGLCIILFYALTSAINLWQPQIGTHSSLPFSFSLSTITLPNGLFPWTAIALIAIALQQHNQRSTTVTYPIDCCPSFFKKSKYQESSSRTINMAFQGSNQLVFILFLMTITLLGAAWLLQYTGQPMPTRSILISLILLIITIIYFKNIHIKKYMHQLCQQTTPTLIILGLSLVVLTLIIYYLAAILPNQTSTMTTDSATQWLLRDGLQPYWNLFMQYGWVGMIALLSPYFAYRGRGLSPRQLIFQILLLPLLLSLLTLLPQTSLNTLSHIMHACPLWLLLVISIVCTFSLLFLTLKPKHRAIMMSCSLPQPDQFKPRSITDAVFLLLGMTLIGLILFFQQGILLLLVLVISRNLLLMIPVMSIALRFLQQASHSPSDKHP